MEGVVIRYIGDVHGSIDDYLSLIEGVNESIQCGDMGIGFGVDDFVIPQNHLFIRGNHDNPERCANHPNWIKDGTYKDGRFFLGGAWSIDWQWRQDYEFSTGKKIWWEKEQCSFPELEEIVDYYEFRKPEIVVSHDCPTIMAMEINSHHQWDESRTRLALDSMFSIHQPTLWVFGHHHIHKDVKIGNTRFICLAELEYIDL